SRKKSHGERRLPRMDDVDMDQRCLLPSDARLAARGRSLALGAAHPSAAPAVVFQEFSNEKRCRAAKPALEGSLKEAGAKLRSGLEDLKSIGEADPKQVRSMSCGGRSRLNP